MSLASVYTDIWGNIVAVLTENTFHRQSMIIRVIVIQTFEEETDSISSLYIHS